MAERKPVVLVGGQLLELPSGDTLPATPPTGSAGGVLSGSFPNPGFAVDMATQGELDAVSSAVNSKLGDAPSDGKTYGRKDAAWAEVVAGPAGSVDNEVALFDGVTGKLIKGGGVLNTGAYAEEDRWKLQAFLVMAMTPSATAPPWALGSYYPQSAQVVANGHTAIRGITGDIYTMTDGVWVLTNPFDATSNGSRIAFAQFGDVGPFLWVRSAGVTSRTLMHQGSGNIRYSEGTAGVDFVNHSVRTKLNEIGRLINLTTANKTDIVASINELAAALDGKQPTLAYKITVSTTEPGSPAVGDIWISY